MKFSKTIFFATAMSLIVFSASAAVTFDPTENAAYDGLSIIQENLTDLDNGFLTEITLTAGGGTFNSNVGDFGIGDDEINGTSESITITFSTDIFFNYIDLGGVGSSDGTDSASFTIGGSTTILQTGATDFDGGSDIYTPSSPIFLAQGDSILLTGSTATSSYDLEAINVTVTPEPNAYALLSGICALAFVMLRRRSVK